MFYFSEKLVKSGVKSIILLYIKSVIELFYITITYSLHSQEESLFPQHSLPQPDSMSQLIPALNAAAGNCFASR